jgi:hypothetical protein
MGSTPILCIIEISGEISKESAGYLSCPKREDKNRMKRMKTLCMSKIN